MSVLSNVAETGISSAPAPGLRALVFAGQNSEGDRLHSFLARLGLRAELVDSVRMLLERLAAADFDFVFLGDYFAGISAADLARVIVCRWPEKDRHRIVAVAAVETLTLRRNCREAGVEAIIAGPVTSEKVTAAICRLLAG